jgi:hypothetical protein
MSERMEFISNCDKESLLNELTDHCDRIIQKNGRESSGE